MPITNSSSRLATQDWTIVHSSMNIKCCHSCMAFMISLNHSGLDWNQGTMSLCSLPWDLHSRTFSMCAGRPFPQVQQWWLLTRWYISAHYQYLVFTTCHDLTHLQLTRLEAIHLCNFIHCDIKLNNILVGDTAQNGMLYLIDFNATHQYQDSHTHIHIPFHNGLPFIGTPAFVSINSHPGSKLSHRDDLESLAYLLIYLLCGSLPWFNTTQWQSATLKMKQSISSEELCKTCPPEFLQFLEYSCALSFTEKPDYAHFRSIFRNLSIDPILDWQASSIFLVDLGTLQVLREAPVKGTRLEHYDATVKKTLKRCVWLWLSQFTLKTYPSR